MALLFAIVFWTEGLHWQMPLIALSWGLLLTLAIIDTEHLAVPDSLNLLALLFALLAFAGTLERLEAALIAAGILTLLRIVLSYLLKKEAMGEADIVIVATLAALMGLEQALQGIFAAALLALPVALWYKWRTGEEPMTPFIPFLAGGGFLVYLGHHLIGF